MRTSLIRTPPSFNATVNAMALEDMIESSDAKLKMESQGSSKILSELNQPILGKITGIFGKLDSYSVNKRFYSEKFWRQLLASDHVKTMLDTGRFLGIFEHPNITKQFTDDGQFTVAHPSNAAIVTKRLWIEGKNVMGVAYLLNTPLGRLLHTYFNAKDEFGKPMFEMNISARGYSERDYFDHRGIDIMDPNDYYLKGFDIVLKPGIKGARVKMESETPDSLIVSRLELLSREVAFRMKYENDLRTELNLKCV